MRLSEQLWPYLAYPTPKIARIKDYKIGLLRWFLLFLIFVYVVGYQILWRGNHLETQDLSGVYQLQLDTPTRNNCDPINVECMQNFTSMSALPYCGQSPKAGPIKLPCQYWDAQQLGQLTDQGLMMPTRLATFYQRAGCTPSAGNNWTCVGWLYDFLDKKGHVQAKRGQASPIEDIFIADIERYTLLIDHSVRGALGSRIYASDMVGYWLDCNQENESDAGCVPTPIACGHESCQNRNRNLAQTRTLEGSPKFRGDRRSLSLASEDRFLKAKKENADTNRTSTLSKNLTEASPQKLLQTNSSKPAADSAKTRSELLRAPSAPLGNPDNPSEVPARVEHLESLGAVSLAQGDIFTIGMLLKAANISLDKRRHHVPSWVGGSYRSSGFVLVIRIHYTNIESWLGLKVLPWKIQGPTMHYTYRITKHASHDDFMLRQVQKGGPNEPNNSRVVKEYHGIRVLIEQSGTVAVWDNIQLLLILTTTLALMAVASCITDSVAMNCLPNSEEYWAIKFERPRASGRGKKAFDKKGMHFSPRSDEQEPTEASEDYGAISHRESFTC